MGMKLNVVTAFANHGHNVRQPMSTRNLAEKRLLEVRRLQAILVEYAHLITNPELAKRGVPENVMGELFGEFSAEVYRAETIVRNCRRPHFRVDGQEDLESRARANEVSHDDFFVDNESPEYSSCCLCLRVFSIGTASCGWVKAALSFAVTLRSSPMPRCAP
jgi:hypothetical protein